MCVWRGNVPFLTFLGQARIIGRRKRSCVKHVFVPKWGRFEPLPLWNKYSRKYLRRIISQPCNVGWASALLYDFFVITVLFDKDYPMTGNPKCFLKPPWHVSVSVKDTWRELDECFTISPFPNGDIEAKLVVPNPHFGFNYGIFWMPGLT